MEMASSFGGGAILFSRGLAASRRHTCLPSADDDFPSASSGAYRGPCLVLGNYKHLGFAKTQIPRPARRFGITAESTRSSSVGAADPTVVPDNEFAISKISFGVIGLSVGVALLSYGFGGYFNLLPGSEWSALMLTYGFPLAIIGMALKYAELKPVPCMTYSDAQLLREKCATPILKQVRNDVTRFRYGDEQHLDEALKRIFQYGQGGGIPRRSAPVLKMIREEVTPEGRYSLTLVFEAKGLDLQEFEKRQAKFTSFFGPGVIAEIAGGEDKLFEVRLISNATADQ